MSPICLNCQQPASGKYCSNCGQKTDTHRITLKHFLAHDLLHGFWHLDRGILFTVKEAIVRPGKAALDYISGKRVRYYNVFYLSLLLIALNVVLWHFADMILGEDKVQDEDTEFMQFMTRYMKVMILSVVPLFAINGRVIFNKLRLNLPEHFILGGITLVGILLVCLLLPPLYLLERTTWEYFALAKALMLIPITLYPVWTYRNASKGKYSFLGFLWRAILFLLLLLWEMLFLLGAAGYLFTSSSTFEIVL